MTKKQLETETTDQPQGASPINFGVNLAAYRKSKKISQKELATQAGLTEGCIHNIEKGRRFPNISTIIKLTKVTQMPFERLVADADDLQAS